MILMLIPGLKFYLQGGGGGVGPHIFGTCPDCVAQADATSCFGVCKNCLPQNTAIEGFMEQLQMYQVNLSDDPARL